MESRKLEIILHSAKGLFNVKFFGTMDPYAVVWIAGEGKVSKPCKTAIAKKGASCPVWDCPMEFDVVPMQNNSILFCEIIHDGKLFDRKIGEVQVHFTDLQNGDASGKKVSYPVKTSSGEVKGEIILSHKFSEQIVTSGKIDGTGTSTGKVAGTPRKKLRQKKLQRKKKDGTIKRIATNVGTKVATEAVLFAGTVGALLSVGSIYDGNGTSAEDEDEDEYEDEGEDEDVDEEEDEDVDEEEEEDEDEY